MEPQSAHTISEELARGREALLSGDPEMAAVLAYDLLSHSPACADGFHLAGLSAAVTRDFPLAIALISRALDLSPERAAWMSDLAAAYGSNGQWEEAAQLLRQAVECCPRNGLFRKNLARALLNTGKLIDAIATGRAAVALSPDCTQSLLVLGRALSLVGRYDEAALQFQAALASQPADLRLHASLAETYRRGARDFCALKHLRRMAHLRPDDFQILANVAATEFSAGNIQKGIKLSRRILAANAETASVHSSYLCMLLHDPNQTLGSLRDAHEVWSMRHSKMASGLPTFANSRNQIRTLRIGYIGGEFGASPFRHFLLPLLRRHDRANFDIVCYHSRPKSDSHTSQFRDLADEWHDCADLGLEQLASKIRQDAIDVLCDISGHYPDNRLRIFALRVAPVQVTFPNYPATTGMSSVQWIVSDRWVCPPGSEAQYSEAVYRLFSGYLAYEAPLDAPVIQPLPAKKNRVITFGLFQRPAKINGRVWNAIAQILLQTPRSHLLVHYSSPELDEPKSQARRAIESQLAKRGVARSRILFRGLLPIAAHLTVVSEVDVALDTFPYNGQTTTCECLWMGVPVVTVVGRTHVERVGYELLDRVGLSHFACATEEEYVRTALCLVLNLDNLEHLRGSLRPRMEKTIVRDAITITQELEQAYRDMWRHWCTQPSDYFSGVLHEQ